jgi:putative ABC transport system permease protein
MTGLIARVRSLWRGVRRRAEIEAEMNEEFRLHVELRAQDYVRSGMSEPEAMRRARQEFGRPERYKDEARESRGLHRIDWIRFSWLDFKLGFRMLARYPGLTLVGCLAIAFAIALGTMYFEAIGKVLRPTIPLDEGDRIVAIQNWDVSTSRSERRLLRDFAGWREQLRSIADLGAALPFERNLATGDGSIEPVLGAEITASAFRLARVQPMLGRTLLDTDEQQGAPAVVVLGFDVWQRRFGGDPRVVGRAVKLGSTSATVVGVMPAGFGFPVYQRIWAPLRVNVSDFKPREGPVVQVFGRLAPGVSLEEAQTELNAVALRAAADYPDTHRNLRPRVNTYGALPGDNAEQAEIVIVVYALNIAFAMLLVVVCANIATLVFARTATRGWEITVRNALGASRTRIVTQLFVEALVLAGVSALLGLVAAALALRWGMAVVQSAGASLPFWVNAKLSPGTVFYAALLTLLGATIVGIVPALRVTGPNVQAALRREAADRSGLRFGGFWTGIIVAQVALTVAFLPLAVAGGLQAGRFARRAAGIGAEHYLSARIDLDNEVVARDSQEVADFRVRSRGTYHLLEQRLLAEPGVERVTFANRLPGMDQFKYNIEVDSVSADTTVDPLRRTTAASVAPGFFDAFRTPLIAGRGFVASDVEHDRVVIVNQAFVHHVLADRNAIGRRIRYTSQGEDDARDTAKWYEIVGVVKNGGWLPPEPRVEASAVYHPIMPGGDGSVRVALRVRGDPVNLAPRLRTIAAGVDPTLRLHDVVPLSKIGGHEARINWILTWVGAVVAFIVLLLSATGIHSLMAFTVARRMREIGIRVALGAHPRRIVTGIFSRAFLQLGLGIVAGCSVAALLGLNSRKDLGILLTAVTVMMVVGMLACAVPLRRALRIDPTEALRSDG